MVSYTVKSLFFLLFVLTLAGCGNEGAQEQAQTSVTNGFVPNPNGFSFTNYGDIKNDDLSNENIATLYGNENVCYNKDGSNCLLSAMGNFYKKIQIDGQKGGQCYGFAVATAMLYNGGYAYNGKYSPSEFFR